MAVLLSAVGVWRGRVGGRGRNEWSGAGQVRKRRQAQCLADVRELEHHRGPSCTPTTRDRRHSPRASTPFLAITWWTLTFDPLLLDPLIFHRLSFHSLSPLSLSPYTLPPKLKPHCIPLGRGRPPALVPLPARAWPGKAPRPAGLRQTRARRNRPRRRGCQRAVGGFRESYRSSRWVSMKPNSLATQQEGRWILGRGGEGQRGLTDLGAGEGGAGGAPGVRARRTNRTSQWR